MNENSLRRSNWPPSGEPVRAAQGAARGSDSQADPLFELHRALSQGEPARQSRGHQAVKRGEPDFDSLFDGIDPGAFEAALRKDRPSPTEVYRQAVQAEPSRHDGIFEREFARPQQAGPSQPAFARTLNSEPSGRRPPAPDDAFDYEAAPNFDDEADLEPPRPEAAAAVQRKQPRGLVTVLVVLGLVVVGLGAVAFASFFSWKGQAVATGEPIVVKADPRPNRVAPEAQPEQQSAGQGAGKVIFDRLGSDKQAPQTERLVPREEQPSIVVAPRQPAQAAPPAPAGQLSEPRRVSTTTIRVKPDGSLESEPTRQNAAQQPNVPTIPVRAEPVAPHALSASPTALGGGQPNPLPAPATAGAGNAPPVTVPTVASAQPRPQPAPQSPGLATPVVREIRSSAQPQAAAPAPQPAAAAAPAESAGFMVQISSQRSREAAQNSFVDLQRRYPNLLSGQSPDIKEVDLGDKGTYYRVRLGPMPSRNEANEFCTKFRAAGGSCVVSAG